MQKNSLFKILFSFLLLLAVQFSRAQTLYTVDQIPDPKNDIGTGYVSNPDHVLSDADVSQLNSNIAALQAKNKVEIAVVIVNDFDPNEEEFGFALKLFRQWGVGKSKANNGLLLFISVERRKYRFITGYGLEGLLPDATLKRIGDHYLVPAFKEGKYSEGTVNALTTIIAYLNQPENQKELSQLLPNEAKDDWRITVAGSIALIILLFVAVLRSMIKKTPHLSKRLASSHTGYDKFIGFGCGGMMMLIIVAGFIIGFIFGFGWVKAIPATSYPWILYGLLSLFLFFRYINAISVLRKIHQDDMNFTLAVKELNGKGIWYLLASPLILLVMLSERFKRVKQADRFKPPLDKQNKEMHRVDRDQYPDGKPYLNDGQVAEEKLGVNHYDIWLSDNEKEYKIISYPVSNYQKFDNCPKCNFRTFSSPKVVTTTKATYSREGEGKEVRECGNCGYEDLVKLVLIPMLIRSSDRSDSSDSGSSRSSSSSDSGSSWGGGDSGGGGAGGSW